MAKYDWNAIPAGKCKCGCGAAVNLTFKQGHDATLKGRLLRDWAAGDRDAGKLLLAKRWSTVELLRKAKNSITPPTIDNLDDYEDQLPD
jgi:hypothetical protein